MTAAHHGFRRRGVPPLPDIVKDPRIRIDQIIHPRTAGSVDPAQLSVISPHRSIRPEPHDILPPSRGTKGRCARTWTWAKNFLQAARTGTPQGAGSASAWDALQCGGPQRWPLRVLMEWVFSKADAINWSDYPGLRLAQQSSEVALPR